MPRKKIEKVEETTEVNESTLDRILQYIDEHSDDNVFNWNEIEIRIKRYIPSDQVDAFVESVVNNLFSEDGTYLASIRDFVEKYCTLAFFTDLDITSDVQKAHRAIYESGVFEFVKPYIPFAQYLSIMDAIDKKIDVILNSNALEATKKIESAGNSFEELGKKLGELMNGIDVDTVNNVVKQLSENGIDEGKIMEAYMKNKK